MYKIKSYPSGLNYNPNYNFMENNSLNYKNSENSDKKKKKFLLQKIWKNYDATTDYQLVDFKSSNEI